MATIPILSREYITASALAPERVKIGVSGPNATLIQSNPNALNIFWSTYFGVSNYIMNINDSLYYNSSVPPYNNKWSIVQEGANWFIYFIVNPYTYTLFISYMDWTSFNFPYDLAPIDPNYISVTYQTDQYSPVYNPVVYKFFSPKYNEIGYRYLVDVKTNSNNLIGRIKVVPLPDGGGTYGGAVVGGVGGSGGNCAVFSYNISVGGAGGSIGIVTGKQIGRAHV